VVRMVEKSCASVASVLLIISLVANATYRVATFWRVTSAAEGS
jgi:hypothetical protein